MRRVQVQLRHVADGVAWRVIARAVSALPGAHICAAYASMSIWQHQVWAGGAARHCSHIPAPCATYADWAQGLHLSGCCSSAAAQTHAAHAAAHVQPQMHVWLTCTS